MSARCGNCRYYQPRNDSGECKRRAPVMKLPQQHPERGIWPWVSSGDWCGDYEMNNERAAAFRREMDEQFPEVR